MSLETASYIADLVISNPDGGDARSTADDHLRLIKAVLRRTFPKLDSAMSLSSVQVSYVGDLSASAQSQLNAIRDGSHTAVNALYANSASNALFLGGISANAYARLDATNVASSTDFLRLVNNGFISWYSGATRLGYALMGTPGGLDIGTETSLTAVVRTSGISRIIVNPDGTVTIPGTITGTITTAQTANVANTAASADVAAQANSASYATVAANATNASNAQLLQSLPPSVAMATNTIPVRNSDGDLFARYFQQTAGNETFSIGHVACMRDLDGAWRVAAVALLGQYLEARNISGRTGTTKTLSTSAPSGGSNGDVWYRY